MVKVGDTVVSVSDTCTDITIGNEYVVTAVYDKCFTFRDDGGCKRNRFLRDYRVIPPTPPQKNQQDGYEYELVGTVKPEWLANGAWVVGKETGILYRIIEASGRFICVDKTELGETKELDYITSNFRPHTSSDWKWGDWAMYEGKRVFVIKAESKTQHAMISCAHYPTGLKYVPVSDLTPTF